LDSIVGTKESRSIVQYIGNLLERVKDEILETESYELRLSNFNKKNISANSVQFLVQKYDLVPASDHTNLNDILAKIGVLRATGTSDQIKIKNACKTLSSTTKKYGFIIITKISKNPFRHSIDPLISQDFINKENLMDSALSGINEKTLKRTKTIIPLEAANVKDSVVVINDNFVNGSENCYIILQSLDGINYEILIPWGFEETRFDVPEDFIDPKNPTISRVEKYNTILDDELIKRLQEPMTHPMGSNIEMQMEASYWNGVVGKIKNLVMPEYKEMLTILKDNDITLARLGNMIFDDKMISKIIEKISYIAKEDMIKQTGKAPEDPVAMKQFDNEINSSFWTEMDKISRKLPGRMREIWQEEIEPKIAKRLKKQIKLTPANINSIMEFLGDMLRDTLSIYINRKTGIFITIRKKLDLLSKTLYLA